MGGEVWGVLKIVLCRYDWALIPSSRDISFHICTKSDLDRILESFWALKSRGGRLEREPPARTMTLTLTPSHQSASSFPRRKKGSTVHQVVKASMVRGSLRDNRPLDFQSIKVAAGLALRDEDGSKMCDSTLNGNIL